jgi:RNA polymerase sigma-70 factor (ECF subfamily)
MREAIKDFKVDPMANSRKASSKLKITSELVKRAKDGDKDAFGELISLYENMIYRFCYQRLRTKESAEDATVETFIRAYEKIRTLRKNGKFKKWLFTIASRVCIDEAKNRDRLADPPSDDDIAVVDDSYEESQMRTKRAAMVNQLLEELPLKYKDPILLVFFVNLSYDDAADVLNIPIGTLKSRLWRGLEILKQKFRNRAES